MLAPQGPDGRRGHHEPLFPTPKGQTRIGMKTQRLPGGFGHWGAARAGRGPSHRSTTPRCSRGFAIRACVLFYNTAVRVPSTSGTRKADAHRRGPRPFHSAPSPGPVPSPPGGSRWPRPAARHRPPHGPADLVRGACTTRWGRKTTTPPAAGSAMTRPDSPAGGGNPQALLKRRPPPEHAATIGSAPWSYALGAGPRPQRLPYVALDSTPYYKRGQLPGRRPAASRRLTDRPSRWERRPKRQGPTFSAIPAPFDVVTPAERRAAAASLLHLLDPLRLPAAPPVGRGLTGKRGLSAGSVRPEGCAACSGPFGREFGAATVGHRLRPCTPGRQSLLLLARPSGGASGVFAATKEDGYGAEREEKGRERRKNKHEGIPPRRNPTSWHV